MTLLTQSEVLDLVKAIIASGLDTTGSRGALFQFVKSQFVATIPVGGPPNVQLLNDIGRMNTIERFANGEVPLEIYLGNADFLLAGAEEQARVARSMLSKVKQRASGAPQLDVANMPETKEKIVHTDDMVTLAFMKAGLAAAAAVLKLRVKRFENGKEVENSGNPVTYLGTGWLFSDSLVITNYHVMNARSDGEAKAAIADVLMQTSNAVAQFDFDFDGVEGVNVAVSALEAWSEDLDYVLLRVQPTGRPSLRRMSTAIDISADVVPVNIIQHPGGRSKRYGIRNNLLLAVTPTELRYFTDTEGGSSGSPVFNDIWEVVALHRASKYVEDVQFQGKPTAWVNVGTPIQAIVGDLKVRYPKLAVEANLTS